MRRSTRLLSRLKAWFLVEMPTPNNELFVAWVGRKGIAGIWILRIVYALGISGILLAFLLPLDSLSNRFLALGPSLELLSVPFLSSAILTILARPSRPEIQQGDILLPARTRDDDITAMLAYSISLILTLPRLRTIPFGKLRIYLGATGFALAVVGLAFQIVGALLS
jgi:hypothetical protein